MQGAKLASAEGESMRRICADAAMSAMSSIVRWLFYLHREDAPRCEFRDIYARVRARERRSPTRTL